MCVNVMASLPGKSGSMGDEKWILVMVMHISCGDCLLCGDLLE